MEESTDDQEWPRNATGYRECAALEDSILCSICRDYYNVPLSLMCGHSFCSQCIRSNIQFQERTSSKAHCPQCRMPTDSRQIHPNHELRTIVNHFLLARPHFIQAMSATSQQETAAQQSKRQRIMRKEKAKSQVRKTNRMSQKRGRAEDLDAVIELDSTSEQEAGGKPARPGLRQRSVPVEYFPKDEVQEEDEEISDASDQISSIPDSETSDSLSPSASPPKRRRSSLDSDNKGKRRQASSSGLPSNWAACPICGRTFPMAIFNDHLDKCLQNSNAVENGGEDVQKKSIDKKQLQVPPKLLLSLEKEKSLKDRLRSYNLSTKGSRQELEQRYTKFRLEVQTAMDRNEAGVSYASLAKRIMSREVSETQAGSKAPLLRPAPKRASHPQGSEFDQLIKATKARQAGPSTRMDSTSTRKLCHQVEDEEEVCSQPKETAEIKPSQISKSAGFRRKACA